MVGGGALRADAGPEILRQSAQTDPGHLTWRRINATDTTAALTEIQQALATRGYFKTEPDGNWGPASIDALKRFQHDQNLAKDGKIGSLSLIALGLGPKREPVETEQK